ncbi:hypothetical protein AMIS_12410 [Actinoplanes missouriensis 431]|uniref:Uncharacterized protein n=1 Tax=Actinoplanes missouriensis (strain ATCC 14538 / DSM 43046 / CBS 188.64 / JCM 3121 / NBRC 102363 / NCIMB 12654 / NRRL B-3342 / UNCC 431) TaxID=512565 RepID=I0H0C4_ACTM4|nr:hypothetical protein AMIS_12410 [Actinoplanes missouriensis 431]
MSESRRRREAQQKPRLAILDYRTGEACQPKCLDQAVQHQDRALERGPVHLRDPPALGRHGHAESIAGHHYVA